MEDQIMNKLMQLQQQISQQMGQKTDIYRKENVGVLVVPHGALLHPNNVIANIPDMFIVQNGTFNFSFGGR